MDADTDLALARAAHRRQAWADACVAFDAVDARTPLGVDDLELLAEASQMLGRGDEAIRVLRRAYQAGVDTGTIGAAVRCGFWLHDALVMKGETAQASAWLARATQLAAGQPECAERGYLLVPEAERRYGAADLVAAYETAGQAVTLGVACGDRDLIALATHIQGRCRIRQDRVEDGLGLLDAVMISVTGGEVGPRVASWIYCSVIDACNEVHELRRAREWTTALNRWTDATAQLTGAYAGICRIHRSELLRLSGSWPDAVREAQHASRTLTEGFGEMVAGGAFYQLAEVYRLRGDLPDAAEAFRAASRYGWDVQPGLSLLRLSQGRTDAAAASIRRALGEVTGSLDRSQLLPAYVEVMLAADEIEDARQGATELTEVAERYGTTALYAEAAHARGAVHLHENNPEAALPALRRAWALWRDLDVPYEAARIRIKVGLACRAMRDEDTAVMELDAARHVLQQLGAAPELARIDALVRTRRDAATPAGLTPRELEVLRLVAAGSSNRAIADELFLSERTVARHLSNILAKLRVPSRTAAAAYAFDHGLR
jgi:DNA-binding CsgD family transcriptional regulator